MQKEKLNYYRTKFKIDILSQALFLDKNEVINWGRDSRNISYLIEKIASKLYNFSHLGGNNEIDGINTNYTFSIRCLKENVKFQKSKFIGSSRSCSIEDLYNSVANIDYHIVVDINNFPEVLFCPIHKEDIIKRINNKTITFSGLNKRKFHDLYTRYINYIEISLNNQF